jgi:hypothetical protein
VPFISVYAIHSLGIPGLLQHDGACGWGWCAPWRHGDARSDDPSMTIRLRDATLADLPLLRHWDEQPHVVASDPHDDWQWEQELVRAPDWREQLVAELDGRPIGFVQIIDPAREESHYWGE